MATTAVTQVLLLQAN